MSGENQLPEVSEESAEESAGESAGENAAGSIRAYMAESPVASAALVACVVMGAAAVYLFLPSDLSATRKILGGALAGGGCWLLVMVGRVVG